jgi:16S rRNA (guanine527-N7)-methyltransferase
LTPASREAATAVDVVLTRPDAPIDDAGRDALATYLDLLLRWSRRVNLTGFRTAADAAEGLMYDALEVASFVPHGAVALDVGAGAGGLGTTVAVTRPDVVVRLVEPRSKRAAFLRTVVRELRLGARLEVHEARAEDLPAAAKGADVAWAQAVMPPRQWLALGPRLVAPGGVVLCLTATPLPEGEPVAPPLAYEEVRAYRLPRSGAPRAVTRFRVGVAPTLSSDR